MTLMVTGHRKLVPPGWTDNPYPENNPTIIEWHNKIYQAMYSYVSNYAINWINTHDDAPQFITGMAIGADQMFANVVLSLTAANIPCHLHAACPFKGQDIKWPPKAREAFQNILNRCSTVTNVCEVGYAPWKMQIRNQWMVDRSDQVLAIWDGSAGGTYNCVQYAIQQGRVIYQLNPYNQQVYKING